MDQFYQVIYSSTPFGFNSATLNSLLIDSRENNKRDGLTGALICRSDLYLQLLEGTQKNVLKTIDRIKADDRHVEINILVTQNVERRLFPNWAMKHDPVHSWMWSREEVSDGKILKASTQEILDVFKRISITRIY